MPHYKDTKSNLHWIDSVEHGSYLPANSIQITEEEAETLRVKPAELTYAEKRINNYPSIGDQLDALFKAGVFPAEMAAKIQLVKDTYPKG